MAIPLASLRFRFVRSKSVSQLLFVELLCHRSSAFFHSPILKSLHINVYYDKILYKFEFQHCRSKVKIKVAIFRNICHRSSDLIH